MKRLTIAACLGLVMVIAVGIVRGQAEDGVELKIRLVHQANEGR